MTEAVPPPTTMTEAVELGHGEPLTWVKVASWSLRLPRLQVGCLRCLHHTCLVSNAVFSVSRGLAQLVPPAARRMASWSARL